MGLAQTKTALCKSRLNAKNTRKRKAILSGLLLCQMLGVLHVVSVHGY